MEKNTEKKEFSLPVAEIRRFSVRDIVRTSPIKMPFDPFSDEDDEEL